MNDLISKRAVLAKINLWVNGELSTDKLIESIKKMSGSSSEKPNINEVLDKIKAEIEGLTYYWCEVNPKTVINDVIEIIDKYRQEG